MCDTVVVVGEAGTLFAKNSDRDGNEAQLLDWQPRQAHPNGSTVRCTWIEIPQVRETFAVLLSRPFWMWGAEMGANEQGVVIGNEAVFTNQPYAESGLTGMDLLRLALERAASARQAVDVIVELLQTHGQGGGCGHENRRFTYHNSFLIADAAGAFVLETAGKHHAIEEVRGARSISNGLTIPDFSRRYSDRMRTRVSACRVRRARTQRLARSATGPAEMMRILREHGTPHDLPSYHWLGGGMAAPCMHAGGLVAAAQTTASWVSELTPGGARHWVTATAAPCTSLFKPIRVGEPLDLGPTPSDRDDGASLWWRHERLHRAVMRNPAELGRLFLDQRDKVEAAWLAAPPEPCEAFAEGDRLLEQWTDRVAGQRVDDVRPWYVRRYWNRRNRLAGLSLDRKPAPA